MITVVGFDETKQRKVTCDNYTAIIQYTWADTRSYDHRDYGGGSDTVHCITCPNCKNEIRVGR